MDTLRVNASIDISVPDACVAIVTFNGPLSRLADGSSVAREIYGALQQKGLNGLARLVINLEGVEEIDNSFTQPLLALLPAMVAALKGAMAFCEADAAVKKELPDEVALMTSGQYAVLPSLEDAVSFVRKWQG